MALTFVGSERQYFHHLLPIVEKLDPDEYDYLYCRADLEDWLAARAPDPSRIRTGYPRGPVGPVVVASYQDHRACRRPTVYVEHGAGQTYGGSALRDPSYSGGDGHESTLLFLTPSETVADRWRARYPNVPAVPVGVPKLDRFHVKPPHLPSERRQPGRSTVAISFHAQVRICPESSTALPYYDRTLPTTVRRLRALGVEVLGHGHPRIWPRLRALWEALDVEPVAEFLDLLDRIDLYAADNSSTLPEAASCGIPLLWISNPFWRRTVEHGGRFYDWCAGQYDCWAPEALADRIVDALADPPDVRAAREAMVDRVYVARDGRAAERAVLAIREHVA